MHISPKNVHQLRETLFDKVDLSGIPSKDFQKLFKNMAVFDFESVCVEDENFKDAETTIWFQKHIAIMVSISSNLIQEPIILFVSNTRDLVSSFTDALDNLAQQSEDQMKVNFIQIETAKQVDSLLSWKD